MTKRTSNLHSSWFLGAILPFTIAAIGIGVLLMLGQQKPKQVSEDPSDPKVQLVRMPIVSVDRIRPFEGIDTLDVDLSGTVVPFRQITLASEVAGRVIHKSEECRIGRYVHQGDILFQMDPQDYELDVERLTALRESEYAQQHELDQELANVNRSLILANEDLALQEKEQERMESLSSGFVSETEIAQTRRQRITAANQVVTLQNQLRLLETRRTRMELAERLAGAQLAQAQANLNRTEVKAPISGVIVSESVQKDSYVQKGTTLCVIEDTERVEVSCNLRTDQLLLILDQLEEANAVAPSQRVVRSSSYELPKTPVEVSYRVSGREDVVYQWQGVLSRYEGIGLDAQSRTVPVRITVDNPRDVRRNGERIEEDDNGGLPALVRGMFVDVSVKTQPKRALVLVPKLAIKPGGQVWRFDADPAMLISKGVTESTPVDSTENSSSSIRVSDWEAGRLSIVGGVKTITLIRLPEAGNAEFWITDAADGLIPGTRAIVSPLANIIGDGNDKVRIAVAGNP